ncbi:hypothetical protein AAVH_13151 [Aphelenchoides avenae]|nr:hypothetical protein AAVH_13151 [Aphelenchus avenae]
MSAEEKQSASRLEKPEVKEPDVEASTDVKSPTRTLNVVLKTSPSSNALIEPAVTVKASSPHPKADRRFSLQVDKVPTFAAGTHRRLSALLQRLQPRRGSMFEIKEGEEAKQSASSSGENRRSQRRHSHAPASGRRRPSMYSDLDDENAVCDTAWSVMV